MKPAGGATSVCVSCLQTPWRLCWEPAASKHLPTQWVHTLSLTDRDTETQRHKDTKTQRHKDTETERQRCRETERNWGFVESIIVTVKPKAQPQAENTTKFFSPIGNEWWVYWQEVLGVSAAQSIEVNVVVSVLTYFFLVSHLLLIWTSQPP